MKYSETFPKFHRKAPLLCSLFNNMVAECEILLRKDSGTGLFENISKNQNTFLQNTSRGMFLFFIRLLLMLL